MLLYDIDTCWSTSFGFSDRDTFLQIVQYIRAKHSSTFVPDYARGGTIDLINTRPIITNADSAITEEEMYSQFGFPIGRIIDLSE